MSLLQIDSVQYLCRSHYLPFLSRVGPYSSKTLDRFTYKSDALIEVWGHEASMVPAHHEPLFRWRKKRVQQGETWSHLYAYAKKHPGYVRDVFNEVRDRGPLRHGQLSDPRPSQKSGTWGSGSGGKIAMEWMFRTGQLCARRDPMFRRVYDTPERTIAPEIAALPTPTEAQAHRELLRLAAQSHGIGSAHCLGDYYRLKPSEVKTQLPILVEEGHLLETRVRGWDAPLYRHPDAKCPRSIAAQTVLSPFDPVVWNRKRIQMLFGFDYKIEIYVPAHITKVWVLRFAFPPGRSLGWPNRAKIQPFLQRTYRARRLARRSRKLF